VQPIDLCLYMLSIAGFTCWGIYLIMSGGKETIKRSDDAATDNERNGA